MDKYQHKILSFISQLKQKHKIVPDLITLDDHGKAIIENLFKTKNIQDLDPEYKITEQKKILRLHEIDQYPLIYRLIKMIFPKIKLSSPFNLITNIDNFQDFVQWYRINHTHTNVSIDKLLGHVEPGNYLSDIFNRIKNDPVLNHMHVCCYENRFIGLNSIQEFESMDMIYYKVQFGQNHEDTLRLFINQDTMDTMDTMDKHKKIIGMIIRTVIFVKNQIKTYSKKYQKKKIFGANINVFLGTEKKLLPEQSNDVLCPDNINSGMCLPESYVYCWRREELQKVIIHETIHYYAVDFHYHPDKSKYFDTTKNIIPCGGHDQVNESYTESLAILLHTILISTDPDNMMEMLNLELYHMLVQIAKIMVHFNHDNIDNFTISQTTSVRSYFFLKTMLVQNINDYIGFIGQDMTVNHNRLGKFSELLKKSSDNFINDKNINQNIKLIAQIFMDQKLNNWISTNLRMSLFG